MKKRFNRTKNNRIPLKALPKINLLCSNDELRPILNYILVTKNYFVATDSHALIELPIETYLDQNFIDDMPDRFLIHSEQWKFLTKPFQFIEFNKQKETITIYYLRYKIDIPILKELGFDRSYPNYREIFTATREKLDNITLSASYINKIAKVVNDDRLTLEFNRPGSYINIKARFFNGKLILMPLMNLE